MDFNRSGVPLLEIVSEPDIRSAEEAHAYGVALREVLVYLGVNRGDMEKGEMRFEANVSVRPRGSAEMGTRTEIKNLNSFRALTRAIEYEVQRQIGVLEAGGEIVQQTLGWNEVEGRTYVQRSKEYAHDYRYFPEPDIPPLVIEAAWMEKVRASVPELPREKRERFVAEYGIRPYDAALLVEDRAVADYFEAAAKAASAHGIPAQEIANWMTGEFFRLMKAHNAGMEAVEVGPSQLVALIRLRQAGTVNVTAAKQVLEAIFLTGEEPEAAVERLGLAQISDSEALARIVAEVVAANPRQVAQYRAGKKAVIGWFVGQVMKATRGKANPQEARTLLRRALDEA